MAHENEGRRNALKKIGLALAAVTAADAAGLPAEAQPPRPVTPRTFRVPATVTPAVRQTGDFDVFVAHQGSDASLLVVPSSDSQGSAALSTSLGGAAPAKATIVNGVIHVGLGAAGASRSSVARTGAISFRGAEKTNAALIVR